MGEGVVIGATAGAIFGTVGATIGGFAGGAVGYMQDQRLVKRLLKGHRRYVMVLEKLPKL